MLNQTSITYKRKEFIVLIFLLAAWCMMTIIPLSNIQTGRLLVDYYDRALYFEDGKWFITNTPPVSGYPQIATWLFGIDHVASKSFNTNLQRDIYVAFFSLQMILVLFFAFKVLLRLLPSNRIFYSFLVLLPPTIYFSYSRFDILPAFLCLIAYAAAVKKHWILASFILAVATLTKWYPILLFPGFFIYATRQESKFHWKMVFTFVVTCIVILVLGYLHGGKESFLMPYKFHISRNMEYVALPVLMHHFLSNIVSINLDHYFLAFFILQISIPILALLMNLDSSDSLIHYSILSIGVFILFARIWSPQWFLWIIIFLILSARRVLDVILIVLYNLITYLSFPIIFDAFGPDSFQLKICGLITYVILGYIIIRSIRSIKFAWPKFLLEH